MNPSKSKSLSNQRSSFATILAAILLLLGSAFCFYLFYESYWRIRFEFNELGRYYDAEHQLVYTDSAFVWILPASGFFLVALTLLICAFMPRRAGSG